MDNAEQHRRAEQLHVSKTLEVYHQGFKNLILMRALSKLGHYIATAEFLFDKSAREDKTSSEVTTAAFMKAVDSFMRGATQIYTPQAQAQIYETVIRDLTLRKITIEKEIERDELLSTHIRKMCLSNDFQNFLNDDLQEYAHIISSADAQRVICSYCEVRSLKDFDRYGKQVACWYGIERMFSGYLERLNSPHQQQQELKQA